MRKQERIRIGCIIPNIQQGVYLGYLLEITSFIGQQPVSKDYLIDGDCYRNFSSRGEAVDYAIEQLACGHVVVTSMQDGGYSIQARINESLFFNVPPLMHMISA